jgi:hypothetical protein
MATCVAVVVALYSAREVPTKGSCKLVLDLCSEKWM